VRGGVTVRGERRGESARRSTKYERTPPLPSNGGGGGGGAGRIVSYTFVCVCKNRELRNGSGPIGTQCIRLGGALAKFLPVQSPHRFAEATARLVTPSATRPGSKGLGPRNRHGDRVLAEGGETGLLPAFA